MSMKNQGLQYMLREVSFFVQTETEKFFTIAEKFARKNSGAYREEADSFERLLSRSPQPDELRQEVQAAVPCKKGFAQILQQGMAACMEDSTLQDIDAILAKKVALNLSFESKEYRQDDLLSDLIACKIIMCQIVFNYAFVLGYSYIRMLINPSETTGIFESQLRSHLHSMCLFTIKLSSQYIENQDDFSYINQQIFYTTHLLKLSGIDAAKARQEQDHQFFEEFFPKAFAKGMWDCAMYRRHQQVPQGNPFYDLIHQDDGLYVDNLEQTRQQFQQKHNKLVNLPDKEVRDLIVSNVRASFVRYEFTSKVQYIVACLYWGQRFDLTDAWPPYIKSLFRLLFL